MPTGTLVNLKEDEALPKTADPRRMDQWMLVFRIEPGIVMSRWSRSWPRGDGDCLPVAVDRSQVWDGATTERAESVLALE